MVKVSVIVPCYNVEDWVERCLNSLVNQTLKDIEIICIDDKSTDGTLRKLKKFADTDSRVKVIAHKKNMGVSSARNTGLKIAKGKYIGFVDPDDYVNTDFYEKLYATALETSADVVRGATVITDVSSGDKYIKTDVYNGGIIIFLSAFWSCLYKHDFLKRARISFVDALSFGEDSLFLANVCLSTQNIAFAKDAFYNYFYHRYGSLDSKDLSDSKAESVCKMCEIMEQLIDKSNWTVSDKKKFIYTYIISNIAYNIDKIFSNDVYKRKMFDILVHISNKYKVRGELIKKFKKTKCNFIKRGYYKAFVSYNRYRLYLFGFIPFILVERFDNKKIFKLFETITILKIRY